MSEQARPFRIEQRMTTPSKPGKAPRPVWVAVGVTYGYEDVFRDIGGKKWRGEWSFWEDPTDQLEGAQPESFAERREHFKERAEERAERREEWADKAQERGTARVEAAREFWYQLNGQPMLVDHYSYKSDRNRRDRVHKSESIGFAELKKAEYHGQRADAARKNVEDRVSLPSMVARRDKALAEVRRCDRIINAPTGSYVPFYGIASAEYQDYLRPVRSEHQDKADYWQSRIDAAGGVPHSKATVQPGQMVKIRGEWWIAKRCNPRTVSVEKPADPFDPHAYRWPMKYDYAEIKDVREQEASPAE